MKLFSRQIVRDGSGMFENTAVFTRIDFFESGESRWRIHYFIHLPGRSWEYNPWTDTYCWMKSTLHICWSLGIFDIIYYP